MQRQTSRKVYSTGTGRIAMTLLLLGTSAQAVTSCAFKDDRSTDLGGDGVGGKEAPDTARVGGQGSVVPGGGGEASQAEAGAAAMPGEPNGGGSGGGINTPGSAGTPGELGVTGLVNHNGFTLEDSFFIVGCAEVVGHACSLVTGVCPNQDAPNFLDRGWWFEEDFQLGGELGKTYDITLRVNGVVEAKLYGGGSRRKGEDISDWDSPEGADLFYVGGAPEEQSSAHVYQLSVFEADGITEVEHYFLNSAPHAGWETRRTTTLGYEATITVPGGGVVRYLSQDQDCEAENNCGAGINPEDSCPSPRFVPNEPDLVLPERYGGQKLATLSKPNRPIVAQPWHAQIIHVTVTNVVENP